MPIFLRPSLAGLTLLRCALTALLGLASPRPCVAQASAPAGLAQLLAIPTDLPAVSSAGPVQQQAGAVITDVTFASVNGGPPVQAYLIRPNAPQPTPASLAGVLFVHWYEPGSPTSNRSQFLNEAVQLARQGTVSLLVSTFWSSAERYRARRWQDDYQNSIDQAKDLRRALTVLLAQPGVDAGRIGYVGHDYGAMFGTLVAAVDARPKAFALIAGTARFTDWYLFGSASGRPQGAELAAFQAQFQPLEPVQAITQARAQLYFQFGEQDKYTPPRDFTDLYLAAPATRRLSTYPAAHAMTLDVIRRDRLEWLGQQLGLQAAPAAVVSKQ